MGWGGTWFQQNECPHVWGKNTQVEIILEMG